MMKGVMVNIKVFQGGMCTHVMVEWEFLPEEQ